MEIEIINLPMKKSRFEQCNHEIINKICYYWILEFAFLCVVESFMWSDVSGWQCLSPSQALESESQWRDDLGDEQVLLTFYQKRIDPEIAPGALRRNGRVCVYNHLYKWQPRFSHEARCLDWWQCGSGVE